MNRAACGLIGGLAAIERAPEQCGEKIKRRLKRRREIRSAIVGDADLISPIASKWKATDE
jgi:hypothetical protein